jgi:hypothetical protein
MGVIGRFRIGGERGRKAGRYPICVRIRPAKAKASPPNVILPRAVILGLDPRIGQHRHFVRLLTSLARRQDPRVKPEDDGERPTFSSPVAHPP